MPRLPPRKWTYEKLLEATDKIYKAYLADEISQEEMDDRIALVLIIAGWKTAEFDEEVIARDNSIGCR